MPDSPLAALAGTWQVKHFVDEQAEKLRLGTVPLSIRNSIQTGEILRLVPTKEPHVLYGSYMACSTEFWVVYRRKTNVISIRAKGELRNAGGYVLRTRDGRDIVWESSRHKDVEPGHAILWRRVLKRKCEDLDSTIVPDVPTAFLSRESKRRCACGDMQCRDIVRATSVSFIQIRRPVVLKMGPKKRRLLASARLAAQWNAFPNSEDQDTLIVYVHHMHPFARKQWEAVRHSKKFKTFEIPRAEVEACVPSDDIPQYFQLVAELGVYVPKLTYRPGSMAFAARSNSNTRQPEPETHSSGSTSDAVVGAKVIADLRARALAAEAKIQEMEIELSVLRRQAAARQRRFFTASCHCHGPKRYWTLKNWFGLSNDFADLSTLVIIFHGDHNLKEEHSSDHWSASLTPFEQCLVAKV